MSHSQRIFVLVLLMAALLSACQPVVAGDDTIMMPVTLPAVGSTLIAQNPLGAYAFVDVNVLTMTSEEMLLHQTVLAINNRIVALGATSQIQIPVGVTRIDGAGKYLLPALADMHIHLRQETYLSLLLANGVTTVRNMNGNPQHLVWRELIRRGLWVGPRILTTGPIIAELPAQLPGDRSVETPEGDDRIVAEQKQLGYDFIKVYDGLTPGAYANLMAAARRYNVPVVGHVPDGMSVLGVINDGQRSIEHLEGYLGVYEDQLPAVIAATVTHGVWNCPTLVVCQAPEPSTAPQTPFQHEMYEAIEKMDLAFWFLPGDFDQRSYTYIPISRLQRELIQQLHAAHAPLLLGTDAPMLYAVPGFAVHQELKNLVDAGLSPYEALRTATTNPARFLNQADRFGAIAVGEQADLLLLRANPLVDIRNSRQIEGVMVQGKWLPKETLQRLVDAVAVQQ